MKISWKNTKSKTKTNTIKVTCFINFKVFKKIYTNNFCYIVEEELKEESTKIEEKIKNEREHLKKTEEAKLQKKHQSESVTIKAEIDKIKNDDKLSKEAKEKLIKEYEENYNNMQVIILFQTYFVFSLHDIKNWM